MAAAPPPAAPRQEMAALDLAGLVAGRDWCLHRVAAYLGASPAQAVPLLSTCRAVHEAGVPVFHAPAVWAAAGPCGAAARSFQYSQ